MHFFKKLSPEMQGEYLKLLQDKLTCGNVQSYSHCLHNFLNQESVLNKKNLCYYFTCSLKRLLGQQSFPPFAQILSKEP